MDVDGAAPPRGAIAAALTAAGDTPVDLDELAARWRTARVQVVCRGAARVAENPNAPAKVRGAWGRALGAGASEAALAGGPCTWSAPCGYDLFFNAHGRLTSRLEIPKPYVFALEPLGRELLVELTLFGFAVEWAGEATDALVRALRGGLDEARGRRPLEVAERAIGVSEGLELPPPAPSAALRFRTPVALRSGDAVHVDPAALITSLANRIGGLARWQGAALRVDPAALKRDAAAAGATARWVDAAPSAWRRGSQAQGRSATVAGVTGKLHLDRLSPWVASLLALGTTTHAGSRAALGMGRYEIVPG